MTLRQHNTTPAGLNQSLLISLVSAKPRSFPWWHSPVRADNLKAGAWTAASPKEDIAVRGNTAPMQMDPHLGPK